MCTVEKFFCCVDLKIGIIFIAILDTIFGVFVPIFHTQDCLICVISNYAYWFLFTVACIILLISYFKHSQFLIYPYLVAVILRVNYVFIISNIVTFKIEYLAYWIIIFCLDIYFWICAFSWMLRLRNEIDV